MLFSFSKITSSFSERYSSDVSVLIAQALISSQLSIFMARKTECTTILDIVLTDSIIPQDMTILGPLSVSSRCVVLLVDAISGKKS